jgi:hypothetical protein
MSEGQAKTMIALSQIYQLFLISLFGAWFFVNKEIKDLYKSYKAKIGPTKYIY